LRLITGVRLRSLSQPKAVRWRPPDGLLPVEAVETKYSPLSDHQKAEFAGYASAEGLFD